MKQRGTWVLPAAAFAWLAGTAPLVAQQHGTDAVQLEQGARIFMTTCSPCHGPTGDQISGVALASGHFRHATDDDELAKVITGGIPGTMMPPNNLSARDLPALVAYLHAMKDFNTRKVALGDPARGQAIFDGKGQCLECHRMKDRGSHLALDLSDVGSLRTPGYIEDAILDPGKLDEPQYRFIKAITRSGETIEGRRLNEDTLTIQIVDTHDHLRSLVKADLKQYSIEQGSHMPSYRGKLSDTELADLVGFLEAQKGDPSAFGGRGGRGRGGRGGRGQ